MGPAADVGGLAVDTGHVPLTKHARPAPPCAARRGVPVAIVNQGVTGGGYAT